MNSASKLGLLGSTLLLVLAGCSVSASDKRAQAERTVSAPAQVSERFAALDRAPPRSVVKSEAVEHTLRHVYSHAGVSIEGDLARTTVTDVFVNDSPAATRLVVRFPLPRDATLSSVVEIVDGQRRSASATEKSAAKREMERAEKAGERAALAEHADGGFVMTLSNVEPGDTRRVELTYVQTLAALGAERSYVFPHQQVDRARPRLFEFSARIAATKKLLSVEAKNHDDTRVIRDSAKTAVVRMHRLDSPLGSDVVLRFSQDSAPIELSGRAARKPEGGTGVFEARFAFNADLAREQAPARDVVIVVDSSLSMAGEPLDIARSAAREAVRLLTPKDRVALVSFAESVRSPSALAPATPELKQSLEQTLNQLVPKGGSNVDAAIDRAAELLAGSKQGVLLFLSDGQPTVGDDLDSLTPASKPEDFAHTMAIIGLFNYPQQKAPLEALFPQRSVRYVPGGRSAESDARSLAALALAPVISELKVTVQGANPGSLVAPSADRLVLGDALRFHGRADKPVHIAISGLLHGRKLEHALDLTPTSDAHALDVVTLEWARARVAQLEERYKAEASDELRGQIVALGTEHSLATMFTSFVATDSLGPDRVMPGDPELRVRATRSAEAVFALLPWGETVHCSYNEDEQLWLGRFLVPRALHDELYRVRVFVTEQSVTQLRTSLFVRVDSRPPQFSLALSSDGTQLLATPIRDVFDLNRDSVRTEYADVRSVLVRIDGALELTLTQDGERWSANMPAPLSAGRHHAKLVATDFASNTAHSDAELEVER